MTIVGRASRVNQSCATTAVPAAPIAVVRFVTHASRSVPDATEDLAMRVLPSVLAAVASSVRFAWNLMKGVQIAMKVNQRKKNAVRPREVRPDDINKLRFTPTAWSKLLYLRDYANTEVGAFGISDANDLLLVSDIVLVRQFCSYAYVSFDDD